MYIDFEPSKLSDELKQKTLDHLADQGIPPVVSSQGIAPGGCDTGEDGGGPGVSGPATDFETGDVSTQALGEEGGATPL
jgi:hypothetical protein